jgi:hypothetical protein
MASFPSVTNGNRSTASGHVNFFTAQTFTTGITLVNQLCCSMPAQGCCGENSISLRKRHTYTRTAKGFYAGR